MSAIHTPRESFYDLRKTTPEVIYRAQAIQVGTWAHWQLMKRACRAKCSQHPEARRALAATGERPLSHRTRHDSRTIPGVIMAEIWMTIRRQLANGATRSTPDEPAAL